MKKKFRGLVLCVIVALLTGAVAVTTVDKLLIEPLLVDSSGGLFERYINFREQYGPIIPPSVFYQDVAEQMSKGDWSFLKGGWFFTFQDGVLYVPEKSALAQELKLPALIQAREDIKTGEIYFFSAPLTNGVAGDFSALAAFKAPEFMPYEKDFPLDLYLSDELSSRRVVWEVTLKSEADAWLDMAFQGNEAQTEELLEGGGMMRMMVPEENINNLWLCLEPQSGSMNLNVFAPEGFTNRVEVYSCPDLISNVWDIAWQDLYPSGTNPVTRDVSGSEVRFYAAGNMDIDSDGDGIPDAREMFVYKTNPNNADTDGDDYTDDWEVFYGMNPLSANLSPQEDSDSDGYINLYEYVHGSNPANSNSIPNATRYVSLTGSNTPPFDTWETATVTIQAALDAATNDYEIILVANGTYTGTGNRELNFNGKKLLLRSTEGPSNCVIDCEWDGHGMIFQAGETRETAVWGIQILHAGGRGLFCSNASPLVGNCILNENSAGGVYSVSGSLLLKNCRFENNYGYNGSAGFFVGGSPELDGCQILNHWVYDGGVLFFTNTEAAVISETTLSGNHRGAVLGNHSSIRLDNCIFSENNNNQFSLSAGAVFKNSDVQISNCSFQSNVNATGAAPRTGGGLYLYNSTSVIQNCLIENNSSERGAITMEGGTAWLQNCTVADNGGRGLFGISNAQVTVRNTILWGNSDGALQTETAADVAFCCTPSGEGVDSITNAPGFISGGYELSPISPCIDRGTSENAPGSDLNGISRWDHPFRSNGIDQSIVDIGAFEFFDVDQDADGIGDAWEIYWFGDTSKTADSDDDGDGLFLLGEYQHLTNPTSADSDADGLTDGDEVNIYHSDPVNADSDRDGLTDGDEVTIYHTDLLNADSDNDTMPDGWEVNNALNPLSSADASGDADSDGLNNVWEYQYGTDPNNADSDNDGVNDGNEVNIYHSNPLNTDSDNDGLSDGNEVSLYNTDPVNPDSDGDGLSDGAEVNTYGTDPGNADTDGDGVNDGAEVANGSNPLKAEDNGVPDTYVQVRLVVGDISPSLSERWGLYIRPTERTTLTDPGNAVASLVNPEFGEIREFVVFLEKGKEYYYDMMHQESSQSFHDYDYYASLGRLWGGSGVYTGANGTCYFMIDDYDQLLGTHSVQDGDPDPTLKNNGTAPKTGRLSAFKLELITPSGDPANAPVDLGDGQNEFTFSTNSPGVLVVNLKAKVSPTGMASQIVSHCHFSVDPIGNSTMTWDSANPNGVPIASNDFLLAKVTFTGLPANNSDFGAKKAAVYFNSAKQDEENYEVFFDKIAANHPGGTATDPNWFFYWKDGQVCGIDNSVIYSTNSGYGWCDPGVDSFVRIGAIASDYNDGPHSYTYGSNTIIGTGSGKGVLCVAETVAHEKEHLNIYNTFGIIIQEKPSNDPDGDAIPSTDEATYGGISTLSSNADTYNLHAYFGYNPIARYDLYGDNDLRCRVKELILSFPVYPDRDWANPGCQSQNKWGP